MNANNWMHLIKASHERDLINAPVISEYISNKEVILLERQRQGFALE